MRIAPFWPTWYGIASWPATNTAFPLAEMQVSWEFDGPLESARSPSRPPQPWVDFSSPSVCQSDC